MNRSLNLFHAGIAFFAVSTLMGCGGAKEATQGSRVDVIYGDDNRREIFNFTNNETMRELSRSTAALLDSSALRDNGDGTMRMQSASFGGANNLCRSEPFFDQPTAPWCSGFLVAPDVLVTAGHCVRSQEECENAAFVFGFGYDTEGKNVTQVPKSEVYSCAKLIKQELSSSGDFAVVRLDRAVAGRKPLKIRRSGAISKQDEVTVIGHPAGLPTKISDHGKVRTITDDKFFTTNLDTYGGNSGSAVFNSATGEVEGILVRGENDFVETSQGCMVSNRCETDSCRGEDVSRASQFLPYIPETANAGGALEALVWNNGKAYFFKGGNYIRYDVTADRADSGYPQPISYGWKGLWADGFDASIMWNNGKAYFFKGSQYIRYDVATDKADPGYPQPIANNWKGLWADGFDTAIMWNNGKAYFFKGGEYIRYDVAADKADPGYPKPISAGWSGVWN